LSVKKVPMRMCAICRALRPKKELIRLVRTADGQVFMDETGKKPGRGLYVCPDKKCVDAALKGSRLEKTMGRAVDQDVREQLKKAVADPGGNPSPPAAESEMR